MDKKNITPEELLKKIVMAADSRKAKDIVALHVTKQTKHTADRRHYRA